MTHESVLKLRAGPDSFLKYASLVLVSLAFALLLFSPTPILVKIPVLVICAAVVLMICHGDHEADGTMLSLFPDGRVRWESWSGLRGRAALSTGHWLSLRYLVLSAADTKRVHRFLVCRSLQPDQEFRTLRTWLRLGLPQQENGPGGMQ